MLQKKYRSKIVSIVNPFKGIYTLEFESLNGNYKYHPGQFLHLAHDSEYDGSGQWPESRCFSMQSNPDEESLKITYAVKGKFTTGMEQQLRVGSEVWLKLPYGDLFTQTHNKSNSVFIAGGTGITPFLSLFGDFSFGTYEKPILYAGFRNHEMNLYMDQMELARKINPGLEIHLVYQDMDGALDIEKIYQDSNNKTSFFISGPPLMISSFKTYLLVQGLSREQIKTDDWE